MTNRPLVPRSLRSSLTRSDGHYIYEVITDTGERFRHCGTIKDVEAVLGIYPNYGYYKLYLPTPPATIDVPHVSIAPDPELPESTLETLDL